MGRSLSLLRRNTSNIDVASAGRTERTGHFLKNYLRSSIFDIEPVVSKGRKL